MKCDRIDTLLAAYLDGEVGPEERAQIDAHVSTCERCQENLRLADLTRQQLRRALKYRANKAEPPKEAWQNVRRTITSERGILFAFMSKFSSPVLRVALVIVVAVGLVWGVLPHFWNGQPLAPTDGIGGGQKMPDHQVTGDGLGGMIMSWSESGTLSAQRLDNEGTLLWGKEGITVAKGMRSNQKPPAIAADGSGGAAFVWSETRQIEDGHETPGLYGQRIGPNGEAVWGENGRLVFTGEGYQSDPRIVADDAGGFFVVWKQVLSDGSQQLRAQRLNGEGATLWEDDGVPIPGAFSSYFEVLGDGCGGIIVVWANATSSASLSGALVNAQRLDANGKLLWAERYVHLPGTYPDVVSNGDGGIISAWRDTNGTHAQNLGPESEPRWGENGIAVGQWAVLAVSSDGSGGAIIVSSGGEQGVLEVQRLESSGNIAWRCTIVAFSGEAEQMRVEGINVASDGSGGAICVWAVAYLSGNFAGSRAQRIDSAGNLSWPNDGVEIFPELSGYSSAWCPDIVGDGLGGAIILTTIRPTWQSYPLYAQRIGANGELLWSAQGLKVH